MTEIDRVLAAYELELADHPQLQTLANRLPDTTRHGEIDQAAIDELRRRLIGEE